MTGSPAPAPITYSDRRDISIEQILPIYVANKWSSAEKPDLLHAGLMNSHGLISAWDGDQLVGIGSAISDGVLNVYYPHLLVDPAYQGRGIGRGIMERFQEIYGDFHMQSLTADRDAVAFYEKCGFTRAGQTEPMWIYDGNDH